MAAARATLRGPAVPGRRQAQAELGRRRPELERAEPVRGERARLQVAAGALRGAPLRRVQLAAAEEAALPGRPPAVR